MGGFRRHRGILTYSNVNTSCYLKKLHGSRRTNFCGATHVCFCHEFQDAPVVLGRFYRKDGKSPGVATEMAWGVRCGCFVAELPKSILFRKSMHGLYIGALM